MDKHIAINDFEIWQGTTRQTEKRSGYHRASLQKITRMNEEYERNLLWYCKPEFLPGYWIDRELLANGPF